MSGYLPCACRDCFEIAIGEKGAMCHECESAGCELDSECCCEPELEEPALENEYGEPVSDTSEGCECGGSHIVEIGDVDGEAAARTCNRCLPAIVGAALAKQHYGGGDLSRYLEPPLLQRAQELGLLKK